MIYKPYEEQTCNAMCIPIKTKVNIGPATCKPTHHSCHFMLITGPLSCHFHVWGDRLQCSFLWASLCYVQPNVSSNTPTITWLCVNRVWAEKPTTCQHPCIQQPKFSQHTDPTKLIHATLASKFYSYFRVSQTLLGFSSTPSRVPHTITSSNLLLRVSSFRH